MEYIYRSIFVLMTVFAQSRAMNASTILLNADFDSVPEGSVTAADLDAATAGGAWSLNATRGATYAVQSDGDDRAVLMDDTTGDNNAIIEFATLSLVEPADISEAAMTCRFRTAVRRTGAGKALRYEFLSGETVAASLEWSEASLNLALGSDAGSSPFAFLGGWNADADAVRDVEVVVDGGNLSVSFGGSSLATTISNGVTRITGLRVYSSGSNAENSQARGVFLDDIAITGTAAPPVARTRPQLRGFSYGADGSAEARIEGLPEASYKLVSSASLDFDSPDQDPVPLVAAEVGDLAFDHVITNADGAAAIQFNLGTADANFARLVEAPVPVVAEREIAVNVSDTLSTVERKPGGFVASWLLDSDAERPRDPSMVEVYQQLGVQSLRFPFGHLSNNYLWTTAPYEQATDGLIPRVATMEQPPANFDWAVNPDGTFRKDLDFDEFIAQCDEAGIKPVVVINVMAHKYTGGPTLAELREAAVEWVRYANVTRDYGVTYWQLGNEQDHHPELMSLEEYRDIYGDFSAAMKEVDPTIRTGLAVIKNRQWARSILDAFPDQVDFVGCHQYQWKGWDVQEWVELSEPLVSNALGIEAEILSSQRPDAEMMVTETSSFGNWFDGSGAPDMLRVLTYAEMLLHLATIDKVAYAHFWTTHTPWEGENSDGGLASALTPDNQLKPTAEVIGLVNNNLGDRMVGADRVVGALRTFASYSVSDGRLVVFLINKSERPALATLRLTGMSPQSVAGRVVYSGDGYLDLAPVKRTDRNATIRGDQVTTTLPGVSFTILTVE